MEKGPTRNARRRIPSNSHSNSILFDSTVLNQKDRTKFNFNHFLQSDIPPMYHIDITNESKTLKSFKLHQNEELKGFNIKEIQHKLKADFKLDLIDHKTKVSVPKKGDLGIKRKRGRPPVKKDVLIDELYKPIHDRMLKDEKRFVDSEKSIIKREIDDYLELLPLLGVELKVKDLYWELLGLNIGKLIINDDLLLNLRVILPQITKVDNPNDDDELLMKYRLTVREIQSSLLKYFNIKKLDELLRKENIAYWNGLGVNDQERTTNKDVKSLKRRRLEYRNKLIGPIHKIKFSQSGIQLNIDPISGPYLSKCKVTNDNK